MRRLVFYLTVLVLLAVIAVLVHPTYFVVDSLTWEGVSYLDTAHLERYIGFEPVNILRLSPFRRLQVLRDHPWIESASLRWAWPNRVTLSLGERRPLAMVPVDDSWLLLDEKGVLMPPPIGIDMYTLPIVTNIDLESESMRLASSRVLLAVPQDFLDSISEWNAAERTLITREGTRVLIGDLQDIQRKFELTQLIIEDLAAKGDRAKQIDVRVPRSPTVVRRPPGDR